MAKKLVGREQIKGGYVNYFDNGTTVTVQGGKVVNRGTGTYKPNNTTNAQSTSTTNTDSNVQIVANDASKTGGINVADFAGQLVTDPSLLINKEAGTSLADSAPKITEQQTQEGMQSSAPAQGNAGALETTAATGTAATGTAPAPKAAQGYEPALTADKVAEQQMEGQQGTVSDEAQINADDLVQDTEATGRGEDELGKALLESAQQDLNAVDPRATMKGQMDILAEEFVDPLTGQPRIPSWAAGVARNVSRIASFKGMTGTAATAAMAQALLEASMPMAQADASFYQTLTLENLGNKQQATLNRANVLAQLDMANLDARTTAAVTNAQAFLQMDLANLSNDQQAELINTQNRFQSILEDAKSENAARLFTAQSENEMTMFYDNLAAAMEQFNTAQKNNMAQFNVGEINDTAQFNAELENNREQFYKNMQFQIDTANAKWRQTVTLTNNQNAFDAAATDVKNKVGISVEQLNQLWDRADALLDYSWKAGQNDKDRKTQLALVSLKGKLDAAAAEGEGAGKIVGTILGSVLGWLF